MKFNERYKEIINGLDLNEDFKKKAMNALTATALVVGTAVASNKAGEKIGKTLVKKGEEAVAASKATEDKVKARDKYLAGKGPNPDDQVKKEK